MTDWLQTMVKILALALDTEIEPERTSAIARATALAEKNESTLGGSYRRIQHLLPDEFRYLEGKRQAASLASFSDGTEDMGQLDAMDAASIDYTGNVAAMQAMRSCTVRPYARRQRPR